MILKNNETEAYRTERVKTMQYYINNNTALAGLAIIISTIIFTIICVGLSNILDSQRLRN